MIEDVNNFGIETSEEEKQSRQSLCDTCEHNQIISSAHTCMKCACPIDYVIKYKFKICPIGRWSI